MEKEFKNKNDKSGENYKIKDKRLAKDKKEFLSSTIELLNYSIKGKEPKESAIKKWNVLKDKLELKLDYNVHIKNGSGYIVYTLNGLKIINNPKSAQPLINDLNSFCRQCKFLAENIRKKVLDFGCGVGWLAFLIEKNFKAEVYGLDPDKVAVDLGNAFISDKKEKIVYYSSFYNQNIKERKFPFKNSTFDLIISKATLFEAPSKGLGGYVKENLDDLKFTISELDRVLKINGALLIETNTQWKTLYNIFEGTDLHPYAVFVSKKDKKEWKLLKKK